MAPISRTHPHAIWTLGRYLGKFFDIAGIDPHLKNFFDLMPQVDLDEIRRVGNEVWGTDFKEPGVVSGALDEVVNKLPILVEQVGDSGWRGDGYEKFKANIDSDKEFYEQARNLTQNVGQALVAFANAADAVLADKLAGLVGIEGAVVGAVLGLIGGPEGAAAGAIAGALLGLATGIAFAYYGVMLPKVVAAMQQISALDNQPAPQ